MMVLPSPEAIAHGVSCPLSCTAIVVCQYVGYARPKAHVSKLLHRDAQPQEWHKPIQSASMTGLSNAWEDPISKGSRPLAPPISRPMMASNDLWPRYSIRSATAAMHSDEFNLSIDTAGDPIIPPPVNMLENDRGNKRMRQAYSRSRHHPAGKSYQ